jgi:hypothetical protein
MARIGRGCPLRPRVGGDFYEREAAAFLKKGTGGFGGPVTPMILTSCLCTTNLNASAHGLAGINKHRLGLFSHPNVFMAGVTAGYPSLRRVVPSRVA